MLGLLDTALPVSSNLNDLIPPIRIVLWSTDESRPRFCARIERVNKRLAVFVAGAPEELTEASEVEGLCLVWDESDKAITLNPNAPRHSDVS